MNNYSKQILPKHFPVKKLKTFLIITLLKQEIKLIKE